MLHCGARFLHRRVLTLWGAQVTTHKSSSSKPAPETASKKPQSSYNSLNLDDGKVFRLKTKWELTRGLLVFFLCSSPWLVQKAPKLLSVTRRILGRSLWSSALRLTLYGQFVAGETHKEIKETLQRLQHLGVRPLLAVPIEEDVGEEKEGEGWYDKNAQSMITCLDLSVGGAPNPMMQLKVTALMAAELCKTITLCLQNKEGISDLSIERVMAAMSGHEVSFSCLTQEENQHFQKSLRRLNSIAQYAVQKGVRVLVDAEYTYINPALTLVTIAMMATWNTQKPWIWNTYQAYLKDTLERLKQDVAIAERLGVCFGVKLVRGAYLNKERKLAKEKEYPDPVQPSWEATNKSYRRCLDFGLDQVSQVKERFEMIVATHNEGSVTHAVQRMSEMGINKTAGPISFGQLLGMCDQVSLALGQAGYAIYKSIPYGSVEEVIPYLIRRAHENQSVLLGIRKERDLLFLELQRRILRRP
ncbi:hydroxyproline dehydrogenase-like [Protobothrops mucrosquamatus]|uniref:hydroxyproline dehydrogenase-like n=1 Tax=Protobothrops mucrosquamatus TaxID=103944 RepID=UPI000775B8E4|nr:hydroxyproline dehydrogenase-like [Protobothrops mucrosquamatus]